MVRYEALRTGCPPTYDDNGNTATRLENGVTKTYSWDMDDKMTGLTTSDGSQSAAHVYAYNGDRLQRTLNGTTWSYLYSKEDTLKVAQPGGSLYITQGPGIDDVLAETIDGTPTYAYKNMLSSVVSLTDSAGLVTRFYPYDAWGNTSTWPDPATDPNPYGYTGREWDGFGRYCYRRRQYRFAEGRFLSADPIGTGFGAELPYAYVSNDPILFQDPTGLAKVCVRRFAAGPIMQGFPPRHCYIVFSDGSTLSYDNQGVRPDPATNTAFKSCADIDSPHPPGHSCTCTESCLKKAMHNNDNPRAKNHGYRFFQHNCCDAVRNAIRQCGCKMPWGLAITNLGL